MSRSMHLPEHSEKRQSESTGSPPRLVIEPAGGWRLIDWRELVRYRDLLYFLVLRDIKVVYKQTILGFGWAILRPLFAMIIFSVVFGKMAKVPSDGIPYPVFSYAALVPWTYFSSSLNGATKSLIQNRAMVTKVYFPRLVIPLTPVLAKLIDFVIALALVGVLMAWYGITPNSNIVFVPLLVLLMIGTATGAGMWLSGLAIQYRDVGHLMQFMTQILMYAAPVAWPASLVRQQYPEFVLVYGLYPMAGVIEGFRAAMLGHQAMPWDLIGMGAISSSIVLITGMFYFRRVERVFADVA
jgi:lipopolysaccharide transport system permease protein